MNKDSIDSKTIEALAFFVHGKKFNEYSVTDLVRRDILGGTQVLLDLGFVTRFTEKRDSKDDAVFYSLNDKGRDYFNKIIQYSKDTI